MDTLTKINVDKVKMIRESLGDQVDIALDCADGFSPIELIRPYKILEDYAPLFIEESVLLNRCSKSYR